MIKKQQKRIALLVVCTFMWLMHVSTMPLAAVGTTGLVSCAGMEQGPDCFEAAAQDASPARKTSMLPYALIGVAVVAAAAVLFLAVLKTKYDLRGTWSLTRSNDFNWIINPRLFVFAGSARDAGTLTVTGFADNGPWTAKGKKVDFTMTTNGSYLWTFAGTFTDRDTLSGTVNYRDVSRDINGTWTATRMAE